MKIRTIVLATITVCLAGTAGVLFYQRNLQQSPSPKECVEKQLDSIFKENEAKDRPNDVDLAGLFMYKMQGTQLACGLSDPTEHQETFFENIQAGLHKINYDVTELSESSNTAEVLVNINYFKLLEIVPNAQEEFQNELKKNPSLSSEEKADKIYEAIANEFQKGPSDDSRTQVTVTLYKNDHEWETEDSFEGKIFEAILQQDDQSSTENITSEQSNAENITAEQNIAESSASEQSNAESVTSEQNTTEQSTIEQSTTANQVNVVDVTKKAADDFTVYDQDKNPVRLQDYIGKPLVVNFWASWCPPCQREMPAFQDAINTYGEEVNFMMVNESDTMDEAQAFLDENGYNMDMLFDTDGNAAITYKILYLPRTLFIDENGRIVEDHVGELLETELVDTIKKLIE